MLSFTGVNPSTSASGSQPSGTTKKDKIRQTPSSTQKNKVEAHPRTVVQIVLWYLDFGCSKHMTGDRSQLTNFVNKFLGTIKFGNDHVAKILGYGDYQIGNVKISRVYYVEGLGHNLFFVGQFCYSNLKVAFRQHPCFIFNLKGVDLLTRSRGNNLYTLSLRDMMASSPICLLSKASKTKLWLWHRRLSHLNFGAINHLARHSLVRGLPKLKFERIICVLRVQWVKARRNPTNPNLKTPTKKNSIFCTSIFVAQCMSRVLMERSTSSSLLMIILDLHGLNNGTEFFNQTLREYYEKVDISYETSVARSPQQNGIVERRKRTLIEVARTMLIYAKALLFLWAEVVATACYTQNRSIIRLRHGKTPYELLHDKVPDLSFFYVFGALCYPTNDSENLDFDELAAMASEHSSLGPALHEMTPATISSGLIPNPPPSTSYIPPSRSNWDILFQPLFDELLTPSPSVDHPTPEVIAPIAEVVAPDLAISTGSPSSTTVDHNAPSANVAHMNNDPFFGILIPEHDSKSSSSDVIPTVMHITLLEYYEKDGISHETFVARSPQKNYVFEIRNRTLIEVAHTMLIYAKDPLFLWAEAVATACYTQNRSIIRLRHGKTPYELLHDKLPDLSFFHVFGALCYPTNDSENLEKLQPKADIDFDELTTMASEHSSLEPALHEMKPALTQFRLDQHPPPSNRLVPHQEI
ncbi:retrovirus-related pol polyprotein from transposon TNT 1-94 [Tanacetum coccineum]|uniref:Retrovirus-related pol polyprotein from transposon TNT 1-94 n=1 Tax=Tanacetum coccineum TaxID=301880 RepID=A0ABQ5IEV3_9ASTR